MNPFNVAVQDPSYEVCALVQDGNRYHAIVDRGGSFQPFVACYLYDINTGTWCQGHYCDTYAEACEELAHMITR